MAAADGRPQQPGAAVSFLDAVGQSIVNSASSIDAHIDAGALLERIAADTSPNARQSQKALSELKGLARQAPGAVATAQGAVRTILLVVEQLASIANEDVDCTEGLQDALETLGLLVGASDDQVDAETTRRGAEVAELIIRHGDNGKQLLRLLGIRDISTKYDAMALLQRIYQRFPEPISAALLADPHALGDIMHIVHECHIDYVRNEGIRLLLLLTESNADIQKIVTFQGLVDDIFRIILEEEDLSTGGTVARDLLQCFMNLVRNSMCQRHIRETGGIQLLKEALAAAVCGRRRRDSKGSEEVDSDEAEEDPRPDIPEETRWACLALLTDAALALVGGVRAADDQGESQPEVRANRDALIQAGALGLCTRLKDLRLALPAKLKIVELLEGLGSSELTARVLMSYENSGTPLLFVLVAVLLGRSTVLSLRSALGRVLCCALKRHASLQSFFCSSFRPELEPPPDDVLPAGSQVVAALEAATRGRAEPEQVWFAMHLVLAMIHNSPSVQSMCTTMPIAIPEDAGPAESFLELVFRVFSAIGRDCLDARLDDGSGNADVDNAAASASPTASATPLLAMLKLLTYWLACCPAALTQFTGSPVMVPLAMDLILVGATDDAPFLKAHIAGISALLMGTCLRAASGSGEANGCDTGGPALMTLIAQRVGIEAFQRRVDRLWRSAALQKPPRGFADFCWYDSEFCTFVRNQQQAVQRRMVELYVAEGAGCGGAALSEDVADHYKQLIRVQDTALREVRRENEQLRGEVEAFMQRSLQASSFALVDKMTAMQLENEALHAEVEQLLNEAEERQKRADRERKQLRLVVTELEQQLQSMALGYEQVERTSEALAQENTQLRAMTATVGASNSSVSPAQREEVLSRELASAQRHVSELQVEHAELLELLGHLAAARPGATASMTAPLGAAAAA